MHNDRAVDGLGAACLMAAAGAIVFLALPLLVGLTIDVLGLTEERAGAATSAYFATYLLSSASAYFWISKVTLRRASLIAYSLMTIGLTLGAMANGLHPLVIALAIAGAGGGMLYSLGVAIIAAGKDIDRNYGWLLVAQQTLAAGFLFAAPRWVIPDWGLAGALLTLALIGLALALSIPKIPAGSVRFADAGAGKVSLPRRLKPRLALSALVVHFAGLSALWAFVERLAVNSGLSGEEIGAALSASMLAGLGGAFLVTVLADKFGRRIPLWLATALFAGVCVGFSITLNWWSFLLLAGLLAFAWNFILAYQMSIISNVDGDGSHATLIPAAQSMGAMLGPVCGGWVITLASHGALLAAVALLCLGTAVVFSRLAEKS